MSKCRQVEITVLDLANRLEADSDNYDIFDALEIGPDKPSADDGWEKYDLAQSQYLKEHGAYIVTVRWPEHVRTPRFNSDAWYSEPRSSAG